MATVRSKLKEALQHEKDLAYEGVLLARTPKEKEIAEAWLTSIKNLISVCANRKRY